MALSTFSSINAARITALSLFLTISFSVGTVAAQTTTEPSKNQPKVLTQSEIDAATKSGLTAGKSAVDSGSDSVPEYEEGATESAQGRVKVNGKWERTQDVTGGDYNETKRTKADSVQAAGNMNDLKALHDEEEAEIKAEGRSTVRSQAYSSTWQSYDSYQRGKEDVKETDWTIANTAVKDGREGNVLGEAFADCETTTTVIPGTSESTIKEQNVCEEVVQPGGENGKICDRFRDYTSSPGPSVAGDKSAELYINEQQNSLQCTKNTRAEEYRDTLSSTKTSDLEITTESGGEVCRRELYAEPSTQTTQHNLEADINIDGQSGQNLCKRTVWPTSTPTTAANTKTSKLLINTDMPSNSCTRTVWPTGGTTNVNGSQNGVLSLDNQTSGLSCTRYRWVTTSASVTKTIYVTYTKDFTFGWNPIFTNLPAPADAVFQSVVGTDLTSNVPMTINTFLSPNGLPTYNSDTGWNIAIGSTEGYASQTQGFTYQARITYTYTSASQPGKTFSVRESGDCSDQGTANCPTQWSCITAAPTLINGISVSASDVSGLPLLYPGSSNTCTTANLNRVCGGTASTSNSISIAGSVPAGTTTLSGFTFTVNNQQTGVTVALTQTPTAANGWVAIFRVDRTWFGAGQVNPQITMSWVATVGTVNTEVVDSGNCADTGTSTCPAQWSCTKTAPTTINGIVVTTAMAASKAPLFPGAANTCAEGRLSRTCPSNVVTRTTISIAPELPPNTTSISNFGFVVNNPQAGITVTLVHVPSSANGWNAVFDVSRANFTYVPAMPDITMTWTSTYPVVSAVVEDTGNCSANGSANCPAVWTCQTHAPTTLNGIQVTTAMAGSKAPLFPSAASTCAVGSRDTICSGTAASTTSISIASLLPVGTTAISNFSITVLNPQNGVTVDVVQTPSVSNNWVAILRSSRTDFSYLPNKPRVRLEWNATSPSINVTVRDAGNCNDPGTEACPTKWTCTTTAPTVSNGLTIAPAVAEQHHPLFPASSTPTCTKATLAKVCNGQSGMDSTISIAELVTPDATEITNFAWTVNNPNPQLTVTLLEPPTLANSWVAKFRVVRNYQDGQPAPDKPNVTLTWNMQSEIKVRVRVETEGDCGGTFGAGGMAQVGAEGGTVVTRWAAGAEPRAKDRTRMDLSEAAVAFLVAQAQAQEAPSNPGTCPLSWVCTNPAPGIVDGIQLTLQDLQQRGELYPGENYTCLVAELRGICTGQPGTNITNVSIADKIPSYVRTITNVGWSVTAGGVGVTANLLQTPAFENGWVAVFETTRTDYTVVPTKPTVRITWGMDGPWVPDWTIRDEGNCAAEGDEFCAAKWRCVREAPTRPADCTTIVYSEAYAIAPPQEEVTTDLSRKFPAGVTSLHNFEWSVPEARNASVSLLQLPTAQNGWKATFRIMENRIGPGGGGGTGGGSGGGNWHPPYQQVNLTSPEPIFLSDGGLQVRYAALDASSGRGIAEAALDFLVSPARALVMICEADGSGACGGGGAGAYGVWAKITISFHTGDNPPPPSNPPFSDAVGEQPELFPGDGGKCLEAQKYYDCGNIWVGEECYIDADGVERCVNQPPTEEPPNTCGEYAENPNCELIRDECAAGGMNAEGFCYVRSKLYECKITTTVDDPQIHEETVCKGADSGLTPVCIDGSCYDETTRDEQGTDLAKPAAKLMVAQHQMKDIQVVGGSPGGGGYGPGGDPNVPLNPQIVQSMQEFFLDAIAPTALAQATPTLPDPFATPGGEDPDDQPLDPALYGGFDTLPNGMDFNNLRFFAGQKRDCMKALGGLLNCCKKTPPNQAPTFWKFLEDHLRKTSNAQGQEDSEDEDPEGAWKNLLAGGMPSQEDLMKSLTSNMESLLGGGSTGGGDDTDSSIQNAYNLFKQHEIKEVKPKLAWYCDSDEFELAVGKQIGTCTHLGSFCQTKVLGMCVIKKDRYCCFNSPITRILREQLDRTGVADLGTAKRPNCAGITFEQMSRISMESVDEGEIIGRMHQGEFLPNMTNMASMDFSEMEALLDGARSALGDTTRQSPSSRNEDRLGQIDTAGSYTSIENSQAGYRPGENTDPWTAHNSTVSFATVGEHTLAPGQGLQLPVDRDGDAGGEVVLRLVAGASSTGVAGRDYVIAQNPISNFDGRSSFKVNAPEGAIVGSVIYLTLEAARAAQGDANTTTIKGIDTIKITITED